jgi:hypothetical protein
MTFKSFISRFQFEYVANVVREVWKRFPLTMLCCLPACAISMLALHNSDLVDGDVLARIIMFGAYGGVWFAAEKLFAESRQLSRGRHIAVALAGGLLLALAVFAPREYSAMHGFLAGALGLLLLFAPYIGRQSSEDSVWYFNYCNGIAAAVAAVASGIFCLGLSAVWGSMDYLIYDGNLNDKVYGDIWLIGAWLFGPIALLYQIQKKFDFEKNDCFIPKGIYFIANYLAVPLVLIYTWVLYAYVGKITLTMTLPKGNLAYMVTGFGAAGIAVWLSVYPMRETGTKLLRQFHKYFYPILALPVILLAVGIYTRIEQYGVTEERYAICMALVWLAGLTGYYLLKPARSHIKHVPMVLCALCLIASFGPWGAVPLSTWSQQARLESYLVKAGVKQAGSAWDKSTWSKAKDVSFDDRKEISAILDYMKDSRERAAWLVAPFEKELRQKYFEERRVYDKNATPENTEYPGCGKDYYDGCYNYYQLPEQLMAIWGMEYVGRWQTEDNESYTVNTVNCYSCDTGLVKVAPYDYFVRVSAYIYSGNNNAWDMSAYEGAVTKDAKPKVKFTLDTKGHFAATHADGRAVSFELLPLLEKYRAQNLKTVPEDKDAEMTLRANDGAFAVEIRLSELRGRPGPDKAMIFEGASMTVLFRE